MYKIGQMVKVKVKFYTDEGEHDGTKFAHGMITQLRNRSEIAYVEFLPLENYSDQWVSFDAMRPVQYVEQKIEPPVNC